MKARLQDFLYYRSPVFVQNWLVSYYGTKLDKQRYGKYYQEELAQLRSASHSDIAADQLTRLNDFLQFCATRSPYYQKLFREHGVVLPLQSLEELRQIPPLEKETLRTNRNIHTDVKAEIVGKTGGTTGTSIQIFSTVEDYQRRLAHVDFFKEQHGFHRGMRRASFTGRMICAPWQKHQVFWRLNKPNAQLLLSPVHIGPNTASVYFEAINAFAPAAIDGGPSVMIELAHYMKRNKLRFRTPPLAIFPTAETLSPVAKQLLEEVFEAPVYDQYGSSEGAPIITECKHGNMHLHHESGVVEVDEQGEALVTCLYTHGTPLVRYRVGDRMKLSAKTCPCGHSGPVISSIDGRQMNYVLTKEYGKIFEGDLTTIVRGLPNSVVQVQFHQHALDHITMLYVQDEEKFLPKHERYLRNELRKLFGMEMKIDVEAVDSIPREHNGKALVVKRFFEVKP